MIPDEERTFRIHDLAQMKDVRKATTDPAAITWKLDRLPPDHPQNERYVVIVEKGGEIVAKHTPETWHRLVEKSREVFDEITQ